MLIKYSGHDISSILFLGIYIGTSVAIAAITLDISFTVGENVFASAPNMTAVDGIRCDTMEFTMFHIHAHLDIFVNGKPYYCTFTNRDRSRRTMSLLGAYTR